MTLDEARRPARKAILPDVRGMQVGSARLHLANAGFLVVREHFQDDYGPEDAILQQSPAPGAFLATDAVITLHVNKASWIRFLPSVYQQPARDGSHFVQSLLWITQTVYTSIERRLDRLSDSFSPLTADPEFLPWLAGWMALALDAGWDDRTRRRVLAEAGRLYAVRGSARSLKEWVKRFTGLDVEVVENAWPFEGFRVGVTSSVGHRSMVAEPKRRAHTFVVRVPVTADSMSEDALERLHRVISAEKPAHTMYCLEFAAPPQREAVDVILAIGIDRINIAREL
jgi:phage tail-like protein